MNNTENAISSAVKAGVSQSVGSAHIRHDKDGVSLWSNGKRFALYTGSILIVDPAIHDHPTKLTQHRLNGFFAGIGWTEYRADLWKGKLLLVGG